MVAAPLAAFVAFLLVSRSGAARARGDDEGRVLLPAVRLLYVLAVAWWPRARALAALAITTIAGGVIAAGGRPLPVRDPRDLVERDALAGERLQPLLPRERDLLRPEHPGPLPGAGASSPPWPWPGCAAARWSCGASPLAVAVMAAGMVVTFSRSSALMLMLGLVLLAIRAVGARGGPGDGRAPAGRAGRGGGGVERQHPARGHQRQPAGARERGPLRPGDAAGSRSGARTRSSAPASGAFEKRFEQTLTPVEQRRVRVVISHNAPVTVLSEQGVGGLRALPGPDRRHRLGGRAAGRRSRATSAGRGGPSGPCSRASSCTACSTRRSSRTRSPGSSRPRRCRWPPACGRPAAAAPQPTAPQPLPVP